MSVRYVAVQWTPSKRRYDLIVGAGISAYLLAFLGVGRLLYAGSEAISGPILLMRAFGSCAFVMLHIVLSIGPLARLDRRFLPLLYNRRHLGVATGLVAGLHGLVALGFYHGFGLWNPLVSLLASNTNYGSLRAFPFQVLGLAGLTVLAVMAATSHDFWNRNLGVRTWKALHMLVYPAYAVLVLHVALGAMQARRTILLPILLVAGLVWLAVLHVLAGTREVIRDHAGPPESSSGQTDWLDAGPLEAIPLDRARIVAGPTGERIAVFRHAAGVSAITNVCAHQGGPLGEGKVVDGCVTCPWHGWQYRTADGCAPPPFTEKVPTFRVCVRAGRVRVDPTPVHPGQAVEHQKQQEPKHENVD